MLRTYFSSHSGRQWVTFFIPLTIACIAAILVIIQTTRITPFIDYSYQVETAYRMYRGQIPYRDFFLILPPGTYIILALLMAATGGYNQVVTVIFTACLAVLSVLLINSVLLKLKVSDIPRLMLLILIPLTGQGIYPWPSYDVYAGITFIALFYALLMSTTKRMVTVRFAFLFGFAGTLLLTFKHTTGGAYCAGIIVVYLLILIRYPKRQTLHLLLATIIGILLPVAVVFVVLTISGMFPNVLYQTVTFSSTIRQPAYAVEIIRGQYIYFFSVLLRLLPYLLLFLLPLVLSKSIKVLRQNRWILLLNSGLFAFLAVKSFQGIVALPLIKDRYDTILLFAWVSVYLIYVLLLPYIWLRSKNIQTLLVQLFPLALIIAAHGTYLTHHIVGSSYGLWPVFVITAGVTIMVAKEVVPNLKLTPIVALCVAFVLYALIENYQTLMFFDYVSQDGGVHYSTSSRLLGAGTPGIWMLELDNLLAYVSKNIPLNDSVVETPGEDPFYAASGRKNPTPVLMYHKEIYPLNDIDFPRYFAQNNVQWVIAKTVTQLYGQFGFIDLTEPQYGLTRYYTKTAQIGIYSIYHRNSIPL
ncbi:MAG TPA: hypothetical protein VMR81_08390 [Patescibacteria group bacterium]|nr:hypothetical protein [Patescibacteria group bacterium]